MKKHYTAFFSVLFALPLFAQPTISDGNNSFVPGDAFTTHFGPYYAPPPAGVSGATWDHSQFTTNTTQLTQYVAPLPGAPAGTTVTEQAGTSTYVHYRSSPNLFEQIGLESPLGSLTCSNGIMVFAYPLTMGSEYNDQLVCSGDAQGTPFTRSGTTSITGASWGTLILPYGTFENVLMVDIQQQMNDVVQGSPPFQYNASMQMFIKQGVRSPLLAIYSTGYVGQAQNTYSSMLDQGSVGIEEALHNSIGIELMPNPATTQMDIVYSGTGKSMVFEIYDNLGRMVSNSSLGVSAPGILRNTIDVSMLVPGNYQLRITDSNGAVGMKRFMVQ